MASDANKTILTRVYGHGRGWTFRPKDFLDIAGYGAMRQTLSRLKRQGTSADSYRVSTIIRHHATQQ